MKEETKNRLWIVAIGLVLFVLAGSLFMAATNNEQTSYEYEIKSEQVNDVDRIESNETVAYDELSEPEQDALFKAYKKTDHFLGGSSAVHIDTEEKLDIEDKWRVIEIKGVAVLIGFHGPEEQTGLTPLGGLYMFLAMVCSVGGAMFLMGAFM